MSKCKTSFGPDDKINDKKTLEDIMKQIDDIKSKAKGKSDFSKKAMAFLKQIQMEAKVNELDRLDSEMATTYNISMIDQRKKAFTDKNGNVDYVGIYFSFLTAEGKVADNLKSHNLEAVLVTSQEQFINIMDKHLTGKTFKEKLVLGESFLAAVQKGTHTKEAFDYIESGGKAQVSEEAIQLAKMIRELADKGLELKRGAGFLNEGIENYGISQARAYRPEKIKGREDQFVEAMMRSLNLEETFPDLDESQMREVLGKVAVKIGDSADRIFSEADLRKEVSDFFSSQYRKRYSKQRKFTFKDGGFYKIYSEFGDNNILESIARDTQKLSSDVAFRTIFGPLADQEGHGRQALKAEIGKILKSLKKSDDDFYGKQLKNLNRNADLVQNGVFLNEKSVLDNITGEVHRPANMTLAEVGNFSRTLVASQILGRAILASMADIPSAVNRISEISGKNYLSSAGDLLSQAFELIQSKELRQSLADEMVIPTETGLNNEIRILNSDSKLSSVTNTIGRYFTMANPLTHSQRFLRSSLAALESRYLAKAVSGDYSKLDPIQKAVMSQYGIDEKMAKLANDYAKVNYQGKDMIFTDMFNAIDDLDLKGIDIGPQFNTPSKKRAEIKRRFDSYFFFRSQSGVPLSGIKVKAILNQGVKAGTLHGEALRSAAMLKSIAFSVFNNAVEIMNINAQAGRPQQLVRNAQYAGSMLAAGYTVLSLQSLSNGETPPDPTSPETMKNVLLKGGILGPFFDIAASSVDSNSTMTATNLLKATAGPVFTKGFEYGGALLTMASTENWEKAGSNKKTAGPLGFIKAISENDVNKVQKDLMYLYRQLPGNNLLPVDILLKNSIFDTIRRNNDPRYDSNRARRQERNSGALFQQTDLLE